MNRQLKADVALIIITIFWGLANLLTKILVDDLQVFNLISLRFIIAFFLSVIVFNQNLAKLNLKVIKYALILSAILFGSFTLITIGIKYTTVSNSALLLGLIVIYVPILSISFFKQKPEKEAMIGICFALVGIPLLTLNEGFKINYGDLFCILSPLFTALHIILTKKYSKDVDCIALGVAQLGFLSLFNIALSLFFETPKLPSTSKYWAVMLMLSIMCTAIPIIVQTIAQQYTTPTHTGLIFTLEPVFGAVFAFIFAGEVLSAQGYAGAALLLLGTFIAELDIDRVFKFKGNNDDECIDKSKT